VRALLLSDSRFLLYQRQRVISRHDRRVFVLAGQLYLHEQINRSPDRVQQTGEREVEESEAEIFRGSAGHESFNRFVAALDLPPVAALGEVATPSIRH
jgi:hypothetical protein